MATCPAQAILTQSLHKSAFSVKKINVNVLCVFLLIGYMISVPDLLSNLTDSQRRAVTHQDGPVLVLAGPGSGKTRVITCRAAYLISRSVPPHNILAITFTNKAALEMRQRLQNLQIPPGSTICTFHSLAVRLLREFAVPAGIPRNFSIYDESDQISAMRAALKACQLDAKQYPPGRMLAIISTHKNNIVTPEVLARNCGDFVSRTVAGVYLAYQKHLQDNAALDFDDLIMKLALLLRDNPPLRDKLNSRYRYVMVDEYQDTNHCQYQIARGLALNHSNLMATGDPDQSIYAWRGADIGNILAFEEDYPDCAIIRLEENFRSTPEVLAVADQLIRRNTRRKEKLLFTSKPSGAAPQLIEYDNEQEEALGTAQWIEQCRREGLEYRQIALFYRVNSMSRVLEQALVQAKIPYQIVRGLEFFKRREIKDILAYLQFLNNPADMISLQRIINRPARGIGDTTVSRVLDFNSRRTDDIWHTLNAADHIDTINSAAKAKIKKFVSLIEDLRRHLNDPVERLIQLTYERSGLMELFKTEQNLDAGDNVDELINSAVQYTSAAEQPSLADYLQQIALVSDIDAYNEQAGRVSLMTLHTAKGLEFAAVAIVGVEDGLIPHTRSLNTNDEIEEERRLLFVGMTRAQEKLRLSYACHRTIHGSLMATIRSEFLRDLPGLDFQYFSPDNLDDSDDPPDASDNHQNDFDSCSDDTCLLAPGRLVRHNMFGLGRVIRVISSRDDRLILVQFNTGSRKTLSLKYAPLEIIDFTD